MRGDDMTDTMADRFFAEQEAANSGTQNSREREAQRLLSKFEDACRDANLNEKGQERRVERLYKEAKRMPPSLHGEARAEAGDEVWGMIVARNVRLENRTRPIPVDDLPEDKVENWEKHRVRVEMHKWDLVAPKELTEPCDQCRDNRRCCQLTAKNELDMGCRSCLIHNVECNRPWRQLRQTSAAPLREGSALPLYARLPSVTSDMSEQFPPPLPHFPKATPTPGPSRITPQTPTTRKNTTLITQGAQRKRKNHVMAPPEAPLPIKKRKRDHAERADIDISSDPRSIASQLGSFSKHSTDVPWLTALRDAILKLSPEEQEEIRSDKANRDIWSTLVALDVWKLLNCEPFSTEKYVLVDGVINRAKMWTWDLKGAPLPEESMCSHCAPGQCQRPGRHSAAARCRRCLLKNINGCGIPKVSETPLSLDTVAGSSKHRLVPDEDEDQYVDGASPTKPSKRPASPTKRSRKSVVFLPSAEGEYTNANEFDVPIPTPKKGRGSPVKARFNPEIADMEALITSTDKSQYRSLAFLRSLLPRLLALSYHDQRVLQLAHPDLWSPLIFVVLSDEQCLDDTATQEGLDGNGRWSLNPQGKLLDATLFRWDLQATKVPTGKECRTCKKRGKECEFAAKSGMGFRGAASKRCRSCVLNSTKCSGLSVDALGPDVLALPTQQDSGQVYARPPPTPLLTLRHSYAADDNEGSSHEGASTNGELELRDKDDVLLEEIAEMITVHGEGEDIPWLRTLRAKARRLSPAGTKDLKANSPMYYTQIIALDIWDEQQYDPAVVALPSHLQWSSDGFMNGQRLEDWDLTPVAGEPCSDCHENGAVCYCPPLSGPAVFDPPPESCRRCMFKTPKGAKCDGIFTPRDGVKSRARPPMATGTPVDRQSHLRGSTEPQISSRPVRRGGNVTNTRALSSRDKRTNEADDLGSPIRKKRRTDAEQTNNPSSEPLTELSDDDSTVTTNTEVMAFLRTRQKSFTKGKNFVWDSLDVEWLLALRERVCALPPAEQHEFSKSHPSLHAQLVFVSLGEGNRRLEGTYVKARGRHDNLLLWDLVPLKAVNNCAGCPSGDCERVGMNSRSRKCRACWLKKAPCQLPRLQEDMAAAGLIDEQDEGTDAEETLPETPSLPNGAPETPQLARNDASPARRLPVEDSPTLPAPTDPTAITVDAAFLVCDHPPTLQRELARLQEAAATQLRQAECEIEESRSSLDAFQIRWECANSELDMVRAEVARLKSQLTEQTTDLEHANAIKEAEIASLTTQVAEIRAQKDLDDKKMKSLEEKYKERVNAYGELANTRAMEMQEYERLKIEHMAITGELRVVRDSRDARETELKELRASTSEQVREKEEELQRKESIIRAKDDKIRVLSDEIEVYKAHTSLTAAEVAQLRDDKRETSNDVHDILRLAKRISLRYPGLGSELS
ncbi:hypothetical protein CYLTODRAFT_487004 [Cylindrobasidium torrendii FP15055 ss-10]|uniref:Uncharacterized protein n=1 Tax=Cylindrobasidium torrendii FP15055 ss-10 TaxID=1314674 RepID=A0A0D7BQ56_9AGAR|nr:hypothetical protein CYLTODRAFT_487004 [Cylindrobasidium torrendii FP15055 ss-10]